ncbi:DUF3592 domain-containing protein [Streptomyces fructofermentans]|uniref:Uncharacterized protein n=1 Tax=Streptomyces fructofermentans TaxID=152141 RepID=A0A918N739_9ACTN|nr:DUF3592 domain-containing protein [Streptomyces fructofermentans]GGX41603.1 hypothetical protein GCM10010515_05710 [Streptomyces fructofermentans]
MSERKSVGRGGRGPYRALNGWASPVGVVAFVVLLLVNPFGLTAGQVFGGAVVLSVGVAGVNLLLGRWERAPRWTGRIPPPGRLAARLFSRHGGTSAQSPSPWGRARLAAVGFLLFGVPAGFMGWEARAEDRILRGLREHGHRTDATVVAVSGRSEEGSANSLTVRFDASSGSVRADIDVEGGSGADPTPGTRVPVVHDPSDPAVVRHVDRLDGREADGIRHGSVVFSVLAAGFLVGTCREVVRARQRTAVGRTPDTPHPAA